MLLSIVFFGAAAGLALLCALHRKGNLLLSFLLVCLVCAGVVAALTAGLSLDSVAAGPVLVLCVLLFGKGGDAA